MSADTRPLRNIGEAIAAYTVIAHDEQQPPAVREEAAKVAAILENACDHIFARRQMMKHGSMANDNLRLYFLDRVMEELDI